MEPNRDEISLHFFIDVIGLLHRNGIETIFCTPTPTPPIWLVAEHPEALAINEEGRRFVHGARQHVCTNHPFMRERSRIIVEATAKAVGKLPGVVAWQTDNEFKCHVAECYCETCRKLWARWLDKRYGTIEALNKAWGAEIWSERYQDFSQFPQPLKTPFVHNASLDTMYRLFERDNIAEYQREQTQLIRRYSGTPIMHNKHIGFRVDNSLLLRDLDFASFDAYPESENWREMTFNYDLWRNAKPGRRSFFVMETSCAHNGYLHGFSHPHPAGFLTVEALAAFSAGAKGFSFWLMRQQHAGCEQYHGSLVHSWGAPTIGYEPAQKARKEIRRLEPLLLESEPARAEAAVAYSDRAKVDFMAENIGGFNYNGHMMDIVQVALQELGLPRDFLFEDLDFSGYKLVLTPFLPHLPAEYLERAKRFVEKGGVWIVGPLTSFRTAELTVPTDAALTKALEDFAGVRTRFFHPISKTGAQGEAFGITSPLSQLSAIFDTTTATAKGTILGGLTPGASFLTEQKRGKGLVVMLGSLPEKENNAGLPLFKAICDHYARKAGIALRLETSPGTVAYPRASKKGIFWIAINMDGKGGGVTLDGRAIDLQGGRRINPGRLEIPPFAWRVFRPEKG